MPKKMFLGKNTTLSLHVGSQSRNDAASHPRRMETSRKEFLFFLFHILLTFLSCVFTVLLFSALLSHPTLVLYVPSTIGDSTNMGDT